MKKLIIKIIAVTLMPTAAAAQYEMLSLDQCRRSAVEFNNQLRIAAESGRYAEAVRKSAFANFFPSISATGSYLYSDSDMDFKINGGYLPTFTPDAAGNMVPNINPSTGLYEMYALMPDIDLHLKMNGIYTAGIKAEQPIYMGGKVKAGYRMAQIAERLAEKNEKKATADVIVAVDNAYWNCVKAAQLQLTAEAYLDMLKELERIVTNAHAEGIRSRNDLLKVQVKVNEGELMLRQAENAVRLARMNLCHETGMPLTSHIMPSGAEFESQINIPQTDLHARAEYEMAAYNVDMKLQNVRLTRSEILPNIGAQANYIYANGLKLNGSNVLDKMSFSAGVSVTIPLVNWGGGRNKVRAARSEHLIARINLDDTENKLRLDLAQAINQYEEAALEVRLNTKALEQAEENLKISRDFYSAGMETLSDHLEAQAMWQKAAAELATSKASQMTALTRYRRAAGETLFE